MDKDTITAHRAMKQQDNSYPSLPKFLSARTSKRRLISKKPGYVSSVIRGFHKRVSNWNRAKKSVEVLHEAPIKRIVVEDEVKTPLEVLREQTGDFTPNIVGTI